MAYDNAFEQGRHGKRYYDVDAPRSAGPHPDPLADIIEAIKVAIRDEVGSQLCRMNDDGKRSCHGPVCFCRDAACAAFSVIIQQETRE